MKERVARHQEILEVADIHQFAVVKIISKAYSINLNSRGICGLGPKILNTCSEKYCRNTLFQELLDGWNYSNLYLYSTTSINQSYINQWGEGMLLPMFFFFYIAYQHLALCCSASLSSKLQSVISTLLPINGYFVDAQENVLGSRGGNYCMKKTHTSIWTYCLHLFMEIYA